MLDVISILCVLAEKRGSGMGSNQVPIPSIYGRMSAFGSRRAAVTASHLFRSFLQFLRRICRYIVYWMFVDLATISIFLLVLVHSVFLLCGKAVMVTVQRDGAISQ